MACRAAGGVSSTLANCAGERHIPGFESPEAREADFLLVRAAAVLACSEASLSFSFLLGLLPERGIPVLAENGFCTAGSTRNVRIMDRDGA